MVHAQNWEKMLAIPSLLYIVGLGISASYMPYKFQGLFCLRWRLTLILKNNKTTKMHFSNFFLFTTEASTNMKEGFITHLPPHGVDE